jgi:hypothetical protein
MVKYKNLKGRYGRGPAHTLPSVTQTNQSLSAKEWMSLPVPIVPVPPSFPPSPEQIAAARRRQLIASSKKG